MEKTFFIKKVLASSIVFESTGANKDTATIKVSMGNIMDKAIQYLGRKVRVRYTGGFVIDIVDWQVYFDANFLKIKDLSVKDFQEVEDGIKEIPK